jgi:hypothetical protein
MDACVDACMDEKVDRFKVAVDLYLWMDVKFFEVICYQGIFMYFKKILFLF